MGEPRAADEDAGDGSNGHLTAWRCGLAPGVRVERVGDRVFVTGDRPLAIVEVRPAALRLLSSLAREGERQLRPNELRLLRTLAGAGLAHLEPAATTPTTVTVVVPVRDRPRELAACLASLEAQTYPRDRMDIVVVDDGSAVPVAVPAGVRLVRLDRSRGPGAARNAGAAEARSELVAFIDSDCVADPAWLERLVAELADPEVAAAGGRVVPAARRTWLERYEAVRSPLDLGRTRTDARPARPVPYLVTANMVIRRSDLEAAGGFDPALRWGEDVDLCWRLHARGRRLVYQPAGRVAHRHRGDVRGFASTRANYAGSEAALLERHPEGGRWLGSSPGAAAAVLGGLAALLLGRKRLAAAGALALAAETAVTAQRLRQVGMPARRSVPGLLRGHATGLYWAARQLMRYHGLPVIVATLSCRPLRRRGIVTIAALWAAPAVADWWRLRPRQSLPAFVVAHCLDDTAYQYGLLHGCWRNRTLRPLRVRLRLTGRRDPS